MKFTRILCLLLALVTCLGVLASCGDETGGATDGGDRVNGSWDGVDFGGTEVKMAYSNNRVIDETTFPAADIYTKGPDEVGDNEVFREVLKRNQAAIDALNIKVTYVPKDLDNLEIPDDVRTIVMTAAKTSPDIYNNDMTGLIRSMINGHLWNAKNAGEGVKNYFDFTAKGWYTEYIKGSTFDQNKYYLFAGDYFIDMIRWSWLILVNNDLLSDNIKKVPGYQSIKDLYTYVEEGLWDLDMMAEICSNVFVNGAGGLYDKTEATDKVVGIAINGNFQWMISASTGVTVYYLDKDYKPSVMDNIDQFQLISNKYKKLMEAKGFYDAQGSGTMPAAHFLKRNFVFAQSLLGDMESQEMRDFDMDKGVVPLPMWDSFEQDWYHTVVHDQVEIGAILKTAKQFPAASALMQYLNEESSDVVKAYYDKGLKYKYTDGENATKSREMMDIIRATVDNPFGFQMMKLCYEQYTGSPALTGLFLSNNSTLSSTFSSEHDSYVWCLNQIMNKFAAMD